MNKTRKTYLGKLLELVDAILGDNSTAVQGAVSRIECKYMADGPPSRQEAIELEQLATALRKRNPA